MPVMARCPRLDAVSNKTEIGFVTKIFFFNKKYFYPPPHPPAFPPEPLKGGLCHAPRKSGTPPKKGRGSGGNFGEKTRQNPAKIGLKWGFLGGFGGQK